jgi:diguanylate cyclase (GGDEF)-like protein
VRGQDGVAQRVIGLQTDVSAQVRSEQRLQYEALHDSLTGLPNRTLFIDRLEHVFARAVRRQETSFAVLFFDVDRFKNVNDSLGHLVGDRLLCAISGRLEGILRPSDTVARFGGDEFVVLIEDLVDIQSATAVAQRIQQEFRTPFDLAGTEVFASVSIGIAVWSERYSRPDELLRDADTAMYRAKAMGRNRFIVFDEEMHRRAVASLRLENDLRRALERNEFKVYYQPIVNLQRGKISGFEALVRWHHPTRGLVSPAEFVPLAEEIGLIIPIDRWVLGEACQQLRSWQSEFRDQPPLTVNVNVSSFQFMQSDLITQIDHTLRKTGLYGRSLNLEITESVIMEDAGHASAMLQQLKSLDIGICIDDFGTGYSSLSYLRRFDIDALKVDRSFVSRMLSGGESLEIVRTIISLAANLGKRTVVEGVETAIEYELVRSMGADQIQGYFFSPPVSAGDARVLLELSATADDAVAALIERRQDALDGARSSLAEVAEG